MASPDSTLSNYSDFIKYLSEKTGIKILLKQRRKYSEINALLKTGEAQFALTCTGAFLNGKYEFGLELLSIPVIKGKTTYHSYIIVSKESKIKDFSQLQGKVFAFTDPLSLSGRLYPLYLLDTMGVIPEEFFKKTFYTSSHEKSIESVAYGFAPVIKQVKIIKISPPYGIPPIVVSPIAPKSTKQLMLKTLIGMADDPEGKEILKRLQIDKFILPNPAIYFAAVQLRKAVMRATFHEIQKNF
jgi:phosphonate transport system substrate-binding protein